MIPSARIGGTCAAPDCYNTVLFSSTRFCTLHQPAAQAPATNDVHHAASQPETSRPSGRVLTARRGRQPFWGPSSRNSTRRQESSRESFSTRGDAPAKQSNITESEKRRISTQFSTRRGSGDEQEKGDSIQGRKVENAIHSRMSEKSSSIDRSANATLQTRMIENSAGNAKKATAARISLPDNPGLPGAPSIYSQPTIEKPVSIRRQYVVTDRGMSPVANKEPQSHPSRDLKLEAKSGGHVPLSLSSKSSTSTVKEPLEHPLKELKSTIASELKRPQRLGSQTKVSTEVFTRPGRLHDAVSLSKHPEKALPKEVLSIKGTREMHAKIDDEVNMADASRNSDGAAARPLQAALSLLGGQTGTDRKKSLATFDPVAFDSIIYRQSRLRPPPGVRLSSRIVKNWSTSRNSEQVYLPVNPAIHQMHKRSRHWYKEKCEEIKRRPSRKVWFGKVAARQRWLHAEEEKLQRSRQEARHLTTMPPFEPPEPRRVRRILDFGDVPEKELPEHVHSNPAWLKACAWLRKCEEQTAQYQRQFDKSKEEAELYFRRISAQVNDTNAS